MIAQAQWVMDVKVPRMKFSSHLEVIQSIGVVSSFKVQQTSVY